MFVSTDNHRLYKSK